ncbi:MAG: NAD(P)/FAD-dependent oxidoreductase [Rhodothermia bacterium]|nr:MAG: NAD(P)/FAD-dependent oxidoreductase [Rhodothermia bacterium]
MAGDPDGIFQESTHLGAMTTVDVVVVGGGPVGLFLGCLLVQRGISCRVIEKRTEPTTHSRSIGIHAPALERLADVGVVDELIDSSVVVTEGIAFANTREIGRLSFESCPPPFRFVLAIPQFITEEVLTKQLSVSDSSALIMGSEVQNVQEDERGVTISTDVGEIRSRFVTGCDGQDSFVRESQGIGFPGGQYDDVFVMGDFEDATTFGRRAVVYLTDSGVVESFPLPDGIRRWVARTENLISAPQPFQLSKLVLERTGQVVPTDCCSMISAFSTSHHLADKMASCRILLAGDAAHVLSPIGGQGMNLGWLDAWDAAHVIHDALAAPHEREKLMHRYDLRRRQAATRATKRSEFNMWMGRRSSLQKLKYVGVKMALNTPVKNYFASRFTMRGL